jgi:hypothetical protein
MPVIGQNSTMKKLIAILTLFILSAEANAQFVNSIGLTVGVGAG